VLNDLFVHGPVNLNILYERSNKSLITHGPHVLVMSEQFLLTHLCEDDFEKK
jgi:hypothetical protein